MPEWLIPILEALGGGPMGVVLIAMSVAVVALWRSNNQLHRDRLQDLKEHSATMRDLAVETNRTMDALTAALGVSK